LHERRVELDERAGERGEERDRLRELVLRTQAEADCEPSRLIARQADDGVDRLAEDLLRRLRRDLFDLDAALRRRHHRHAPDGAVDDDAEVELARDLAALLDEEPLHDAALRPRLMRDERLPEERARDRTRLVR